MLNEHINFAGKTAVVTGASRGIGEAAVIRLAKAGANVVLLARSENDILKHSQTIGDKALACVCDVSNWSEVESAFAKAIERFGAIDILINNAGVIDPVARLEDADPHEWGRAVDINLKGVFHGIRAALPVMKNKGKVINISSGAATGALEGWSHYCSTKAAVLSLTRCVHEEYGDKGVSCIGLSPGTVATDMQKVIADSGVNRVSELDWSVHISPEMVAEAIAWLCADTSGNYDGTDFSLKTKAGRLAIGLSDDDL